MRIDTQAKHILIDLENDDTPIYRLLEVHHLFELFEYSQLTLVAPKLWDDPYEDFLNHCYGVDPREPNTRISYHGYSKLIFGQCWTFNKDNDATWRIYSPQKSKVKIKTSIHKLYSLLQKVDMNWFRSYLGKVKYHSVNKIKNNISTAIKGGSFFIDTLVKDFYLNKRDSFKEENEVRLLVKLVKEEGYSNATYQHPDIPEICNLPIDDPLDLIEEIIFDPRMPDTIVRAYRYHLVNTFGFNGECKKSNIYETPKMEIEVEYNRYYPTNRSS